MSDNFDLYRWKWDLKLRNNNLFESTSPLDLENSLKRELFRIFPNASNFKIVLPLKEKNLSGYIRIVSTLDLTKEDISYVEDLLSKHNFKLNKDKSNYYYDEDEDRKFYPTIAFTYL